MASETPEAKVALVTGSSSGIGAATVRQLAREGYKVAVCGSKQDKVDKVCSECAKLSPKNYEVSRPSQCPPIWVAIDHELRSLRQFTHQSKH